MDSELFHALFILLCVITLCNFLFLLGISDSLSSIDIKLKRFLKKVGKK